MKRKFETIAALVLAVCFILTGCTVNSDSPSDSSEGSNNAVTESTEKESEKTSETTSAEPLSLETPAGAVLVGKIKKDADGWYFEPEQPVSIKLTCYEDRTLNYKNLKRIDMFDDSDDGTNKELYRDDTVTIEGLLQNYRDLEDLYFYPCKIERGKTVKVGYAEPELDYPDNEPASYDPSAPLPDGMKPIVKNGHYEYNPYILTVNTLEYLGNDFADFYKTFVDAWLNYETSCPCPNKNYAEAFSSVMYYEFPLFTADGEFDPQNGYDEKTQTLNWSYKTKNKAEHDKLISDFKAEANSFLKEVKSSDSEQKRAESLYHAFCPRMTYDYEIMTSRERIDAYYAYTLHRGVCVTFACAMSQLFAQIGVKATVVSGDTANDGGHVWNLVTLGGKNYFCDSTYELSVNSGKGFTYFGMTMKDRLNDRSGFSKENIVVGALNIKMASEVKISGSSLKVK